MTITVTKTGPRPEPETVILLFVKYPEPGKVKTRLAEFTGEDTAAELARAFAEDTLKLLDDSRFKTVICHEPAERAEDFKSWLGADRKYLPQEGADLGERMKNALARVFDAGCGRAAVLGSDVPDLAPGTLRQAEDSLTRYGTSVIGPAGDGGYFLIGFEKEGFAPEIFDNVEWGTDKVFDQTIDICGNLGSIPVFLPGHDDVDDERGLKALYERNKETEFVNSATWPILKRILG